MRKNQRAALDALFAGKEYTNQSIYTRQHGECLKYREDKPTVYSYGSHYPLLILGTGDTAGEAYLNTAKYSATTSTQQSGAALYLHYEGYRATGDTLAHRGHTYAIYRKTEPETWPGAYGQSTSVFARPDHHSASYEGPAYHADSRTYGPREH